MIDFSAASDQIFMILGLLKSSRRGESDSGISFVVSALFKKIFNAQILIKSNC